MEQPRLPTSFNLLVFTIPRPCLLLHSPLVCFVCVVYLPVCDPSDRWPARPRLAEGLRLPALPPSGYWLLIGKSSKVSLRHAARQSLTDNAVRYSTRGASRCRDWSYSSLRRRHAVPSALRLSITIAMKRRPACVMRVRALISVFCAGSRRPTPSWWATWRTVPAAWTTSRLGPLEPTLWSTTATAVWVSVFKYSHACVWVQNHKQYWQVSLLQSNPLF